MDLPRGFRRKTRQIYAGPVEPENQSVWLFKVIRVDETGSYVDGDRVSDVNLSRLDLGGNQWTFRIEASPEAEHCGGVTLFGAGFGNYNQDLLFKLFYESLEEKINL